MRKSVSKYQAHFIFCIRLLRKLILQTAVTCDMEDAKEKAIKLFQDFRDKDVAISPNLRQMAYSAGVRFGDTEDWRFAWKQYTNSQVPSEKRLWMGSLADSKDSYVLQRYVDKQTILKIP